VEVLATGHPHRSRRLTNPIIHFWKELRRRKVIRVAVVYAVVAWAVAQVAALLFPSLLLPEWASRLVVVLLLLGFPLALVLAWVLEISPTGLKRDRGGEPSPAAQLPVPVDTTCGLDCPSNPGPVNPTDQRRSIVVMPFSNMSGDIDNEYFSDGMSEELLNLLVNVEGLRVPSRTSSFAFKGLNSNIREIAAELGVVMTIDAVAFECRCSVFRRANDWSIVAAARNSQKRPRERCRASPKSWI